MDPRFHGGCEALIPKSRVYSIIHHPSTDGPKKTGFKSLQITPWIHLAPKVHLRVKVMYWKRHFLSDLHFQKLRVPDVRLLGGTAVARNHSNMKVGCWTYQPYYFHYRKTKMIWFCWIFGVLHSGWPEKDRWAMLAAGDTVNLFFSHVKE